MSIKAKYSNQRFGIFGELMMRLNYRKRRKKLFEVREYVIKNAPGYLLVNAKQQKEAQDRLTAASMDAARKKAIFVETIKAKKEMLDLIEELRSEKKYDVSDRLREISNMIPEDSSGLVVSRFKPKDFPKQIGALEF